jgi:RND family efflux transporter MFP subunit
MRTTIQTKITLAILLLLLLTGCDQVAAFTTPQVSPTEISQPMYAIDTSPVVKSEIVPLEVVQLAFVFYGQVQSINVELGDVVQKGDPLVQLETTLLQTDIARAEFVLEGAEAELKVLERRGTDENTRKVAAAKVSVAQADLETARYRLTQATLLAPIEGTIVDMQVEPAEVVGAGQVVLTLADLQKLYVETLDFRETDISKIFVGQPVEVYIEALDVTVNGVVDSIAMQATRVNENKVYKVTIELASQPQGLRWGMSAETRFIVDE